VFPDHDALDSLRESKEDLRESKEDKAGCQVAPGPDFSTHQRERVRERDLPPYETRLSRQLPCFYNWRPDPKAEATDTFRGL